jgi:CRP-like cAMP-binding protein
VERDGVVIATLSEPGAVIGEMAVLLGSAHTATVRAADRSTVRTIVDAIGFLERTPLAALHVATIACARLDATSALVVSLKHELEIPTPHPGLFARLLGALTGPMPPS